MTKPCFEETSSSSVQAQLYCFNSNFYKHSTLWAKRVCAVPENIRSAPLKETFFFFFFALTPTWLEIFCFTLSYEILGFCHPHASEWHGYGYFPEWHNEVFGVTEKIINLEQSTYKRYVKPALFHSFWEAFHDAQSICWTRQWRWLLKRFRQPQCISHRKPTRQYNSVPVWLGSTLGQSFSILTSSGLPSLQKQTPEFHIP